ncbi:hypothetical protein CONLIGDRAFT_147360 [Coniochaeta ligniaria NRRL 30616]|uniref:Sorting nexin MVP1 n=1 Tax=Coniochaeta ligniaria NRRL 30616 TaxID=1408157 RepID=A0A1J7I5B4_9PEZI|nr:hypothetical protein CONLIGDRAFT_147360 [Coniochaeta ligniaria NRRL 30616]
MSLFGSSPPDDAPTTAASAFGRSTSSLFEDEPPMTKSTSSALFQDDDAAGATSPWDLPTPRKPKSRADLLKTLLPASDVPESYIEIFDAVVRDSGSAGKVTAGGVARTLAAAHISADEQGRIMAIVAPSTGSGEVSLGRNEFNALLALIGLAQDGEVPNLDGVDERRRNLPQPKLPGLVDDNKPVLPNLSELGAKPPQRPVTPTRAPSKPSAPASHTRVLQKASMDYPEDPWGAPDMHQNHNHPPFEEQRQNGVEPPLPSIPVNGHGSYGATPQSTVRGRTTSTFTTSTEHSTVDTTQKSTLATGSSPSAGGAWGYFDGNTAAPGGFGEQPPPAASSNPGLDPFGPGSGGSGGGPPGEQPDRTPSRSIGGLGRTGSSIEETIVVTLMPEKEGLLFFQHHNYEVTNPRRGSKVVRRYSDFVWLLDCLHKRYPFRVLPLLPPKRVAVNGNHLSNDGAFIEKRRRGLARFLNALVRHPVLSQEQLVIMFLTVPTELAVWRKQANLSVQDEFAGKPLPPGLEDSLSPAINDLFERTRIGVKRSAELYITICNLMDRLVKRSEGVAADHARIALSLTSLTEANADTYATDTNDVPLLNDGLVAMSKHLRTGQSLMEDEARAWDQGVLEDLKRQRDALVSLRELFDRRERLDRDNIPHLERRIQGSEAKLAGLRAKPEGLVKAGEIERVVESIIKDKESIVTQHNRSVFVKECLRDELVYFQTTQYHVTRWNQDWAQERVKYSEMLADNWRRLLDELEGMPTGD